MAPLSEAPQTPDSSTDNARLKAILVLAGTVFFVLSPLATEPFTGFRDGAFPVPVSEPMIQPEGYAFSIWGVIYLWLVASAGYGLFKRSDAMDWDAGRWPLVVSTGVGASWIAIALAAPVPATVLIWVMWAGAVLALLRGPARDRGWYALPLGLYAGWLTAASCVSLGTVAIGYGLGDEATISWIALVLALIIAVVLTVMLRTPTYPIAVGWALIGVVAANFASAPIFAGAALGGAVALGYLGVKNRGAA